MQQNIWYYNTMKNIIALICVCLTFLIVGCAPMKWCRFVTRPDGTYKVVRCEKSEANTVDGDPTFKNYDIGKAYSAIQKMYELPNFLYPTPF
jgi:hypothetical protein